PLALHARSSARVLALTPRLKHFRGERYNFQELLLSKLAGHRAEHARSDRLAGLVDEHGRVLVEADIRSVAAARLFRGPHEHALHYRAFLCRPIGRSFLDGSGEYVAQVRRES